MRRGTRIGSVIGAAFALLIIMLPQFVVAETQTAVTKVADFKPESDDYDETRNVANETSKTNKDSWDPLPEGIFVGGIIEESKLRIKEVGTASANYLTVATTMRFQAGYLSTGASQFIVRLPVHVTGDAGDGPVRASLKIYESLEGGDNLVAYNADLGNIYSHWTDPGNQSLFGGMSESSWISGNRLYARMLSPLLTDRNYIFEAELQYAQNVPMDLYWQPSDLCSDGITETYINYHWELDPSRTVNRSYTAAADAGWSFVFQRGIGGIAADHTVYYEEYSYIYFEKFIETETLSTTGRVSFIFEFRLNFSDELNYTLRVYWANGTSGAMTEIMSDEYWDNKSARHVLIAATDKNYTIDGVEVDGRYFAWFKIRLRVNNATQLQMLMSYDDSIPGYSEMGYWHNKFTVYKAEDDSDMGQDVFFAPWCTIEIAPYSWNKTYPETSIRDSGVWAGVGDWWDEHWFDVLGCVLVIAGVVLMATGVGAVIGWYLIGAGITMLLMNNVDWIADMARNFVRMIIDGLTWLGTWLWKIGMAIWQAVTWFIDQVIYYGSIILGLLIILVAMVIFIVPIYFEIKILGAFLAMAQGDYEKASAQLAGVVSAGKSMVGRG